jgi:hypothetical protein
MGPRRGRGTLGCALLAILALAAAGCGVEEHPNEQRPSPSARVSVIVNDSGVSVQPGAIGVGPEPTSQLPQNRDVKQPRFRATRPLDVVLVAANLTDRNSELVIRGPGTEDSLEELFANSNGSLETSLRPGTYRISAAGIPGAKPAHLTVGSYRASSQNDVLLP